MTESFENESPLILTPEEARVLGCLMEKEVTTPDAYPLTLNSLLLACNQKTNRNPVVDYDEDIVAEAIEGLRVKHLVYRMDGAGSRVPKYKHRIEERLGLGGGGKALLTVLLLRGAQTPGELRTRSERMHIFLNIEAVETELAEIAEEVEVPLWRKLSPAPGQKEVRYAHLLFGAIDESSREDGGVVLPTEPAVAAVQARNERIGQLEERVATLEAELAEMKTAFADFRQQFE